MCRISKLINNFILKTKTTSSVNMSTQSHSNTNLQETLSHDLEGSFTDEFSFCKRRIVTSDDHEDFVEEISTSAELTPSAQSNKKRHQKEMNKLSSKTTNDLVNIKEEESITIESTKE